MAMFKKMEDKPKGTNIIQLIKENNSIMNNKKSP